MKILVWALAIVVGLGILIGVPLVALQSHRGVKCPSQILIVRGKSGQPIECVCLDGVLSTCFEPGP
jgi:hypothetical protein